MPGTWSRTSASLAHPSCLRDALIAEARASLRTSSPRTTLSGTGPIGLGIVGVQAGIEPSRFCFKVDALDGFEEMPLLLSKPYMR